MKKWLTLFSIITVLLVLVFYVYKNERNAIDFDPSDAWIVFSCGHSTNTVSDSSLYIIRPDGSQLQRITESNLDARNPVWSHDGEWITFLTQSNGVYSIQKIRPDGTSPQTLINIPINTQVDALDWSNANGLIAYTIREFGVSKIQVSDSQGNIQNTVSEIEGMYSSISWSPDGSSIAYTTIAGSTQVGVFVFDLSTNATYTVSDLHSFSNLLWMNSQKDVYIVTRTQGQIGLQLLDMNSMEAGDFNVIESDVIPHSMNIIGNKLVFSGADTNSAYHMFSYDLTTNELLMIADLNCGIGTSDLYEFD